MTGVPGTPWYSNLYFNNVDTSTEAQEAADAVRSFWAALATSLSPGIIFTVEANAVTIDPVSGQPTGNYVTDTDPVTSSGGADPLPWATQALVRLRTPGYVNGRNLQGKLYVPGFTEASSSSGRPVPGINGLINTAAEQIIEAGPEWVVWSRKNGVTAPISSTEVWSEWAVLRSRRD